MTASDLLNSDCLPADQSLTVINDSGIVAADGLTDQLRQACHAWLVKSPSMDTRSNYQRDLGQFLIYCGMKPTDVHELPSIRPHQVAAWRDHLSAEGLTNSSIRRKLTVLRSVFSYLQTYGYAGTNPAHSDFVSAPSAPRDGKTVGLTPEDCRRLLDAPSDKTPLGLRDRALLAVLAYIRTRDRLNNSPAYVLRY